MLLTIALTEEPEIGQNLSVQLRHCRLARAWRSDKYLVQRHLEGLDLCHFAPVVLVDHFDHVADRLLDRVQPDHLLQPRPSRALETGRIWPEQVLLRQEKMIRSAAAPLLRLDTRCLTPRDPRKQVLDRAGVAEAIATATLAESADGDAHVEPVHRALDPHPLVVSFINRVT